ncbi:hypothetical protein [Geosporobacter ferrireducens]|uniref:Uncharacterized protein n=1 Tax=Geosporobacter ferrireducens TaxID=1424294 RepID=A0A1D8GDC2_9FIRM|nr:hypothetical protein [Geosporobacter ferrireducens]AOT68915.1 hypothetical protein Gferi_04705 [Geosporobacter ferrireducens]MTI54847.1 hypothetical protein [Geosporobacter ferrireducens]
MIDWAIKKFHKRSFLYNCLWTAFGLVVLSYILYSGYVAQDDYHKYFKPQQYSYNQFLKKAQLLQTEIHNGMNLLESINEADKTEEIKGEILSKISELQHASMQTKNEMIKVYGHQEPAIREDVKRVHEKMVQMMDLYFTGYEALKEGIMEDDQKKLLRFVKDWDRINSQKQMVDQMIADLWKTRKANIQIIK